MADSIISRAEARASGLKQFFTGIPCGKGHVSARFVGDGKCVECNRLACLRRHQTPERLAKWAELESRKAEKQAKSERWRALNKARQDALSIGALTYIGSPCPKGHDGARYTKHGSCVECVAAKAASSEKKEYDKAYFTANRERISRRTSAYYERNRGRALAASKLWSERNPERSSAIKQSYKHRRRTQEKAGMTGAELAAWKRAQPKVCHWCGAACKSAFVVDHYQPLAKGGRHEVANLVIACPPCNLKKNAKDPYAFAASKGRLF